MIDIVKSDLSGISILRSEYLSSLPEFQELFLEMLVEKAECFRILIKGNIAGYAVMAEEGLLVEFYLKDCFIPDCKKYFSDVITGLNIKKVYCKSFDSLLLNCCLINSYSYKLIGSLYREFIDAPEFPVDEFSISTASEKDYEFLLKQEGELYESPEELIHFIKGGNILMYKKEGNLYGCGYLIKIHKDWDFYDIGMWVNPAFRRQGVAVKIISHLKQICLKNNWTPICGCAIENTASQKTLEKNGFFSKHKLIEFDVKN